MTNIEKIKAMGEKDFATFLLSLIVHNAYDHPIANEMNKQSCSRCPYHGDEYACEDHECPETEEDAFTKWLYTEADFLKEAKANAEQ